MSIDIPALIAEARVSVQAHADFLSLMGMTHGKTDRLYQQIDRLADALEATTTLIDRMTGSQEFFSRLTEGEAERDRYRAALDDIRALLDTPSDERGITWWGWIGEGLGGSLHDDLRSILSRAANDKAAE